MVKELCPLLSYVKKYRFRYIAGFFCLILTSGGQILIPQIVKRTIDGIIAGLDLPAILRFILLLAGLAAVISIFRFSWRYFIIGASRRIETDLRKKLFDHLLILQTDFYSNRKTGDLMALATNDMNAVRMASGMAIVAFTDGIFMTVTIIAILFREAPSLALYIILPLPLITALIISLGSIVGKKFKRVQEVFADLSSLAQESIAGVRVIKSFVKEKYFLKKFAETNDEYLKINMNLVRLWGLFHPIVTFLSGLTSALLLYFGGLAVYRKTLSAGELVALFSYLEMLIWPMIGAGFTVNLLQRGAASMGRINEILHTEPNIVSPPHAARHVPRGHILFKGLSFSYGTEDTIILRDLHFELPAGKNLGILGRTGSGKSSLINLLPRIRNPAPGTLFLDNIDILQYDIAFLRRGFGLVPQDTFLFSTSISANIEIGSETPLSKEEISRFADISTISRDIAIFPEGIETQIGEKGLTLSGGQKQRIAISRALARDPNILIFDDALSAVDTETEEKILSHVIDYRRGKTNIIISHRISTLSHCDIVIVLEKGALIQQGTPSELIQQEGLYREIYDIQSAESAKSQGRQK